MGGVSALMKLRLFSLRGDLCKGTRLRDHHARVDEVAITSTPATTTAGKFTDHHSRQPPYNAISNGRSATTTRSTTFRFPHAGLRRWRPARTLARPRNPTGTGEQEPSKTARTGRPLSCLARHVRLGSNAGLRRKTGAKSSKADFGLLGPPPTALPLPPSPFRVLTEGRRFSQDEGPTSVGKMSYLPVTWPADGSGSSVMNNPCNSTCPKRPPLARRSPGRPPGGLCRSASSRGPSPPRIPPAPPESFFHLPAGGRNRAALSRPRNPRVSSGGRHGRGLQGPPAQLDRTVALKILPTTWPPIRPSPSASTAKPARSPGSSHPHIVGVFDFGTRGPLSSTS